MGRRCIEVFFGKLIVVALEQDEMPNDAQRKRRHEVRKNPQDKTLDHFRFP
jgi:hypothetical protein